MLSADIIYLMQFQKKLLVSRKKPTLINFNIYLPFIENLKNRIINMKLYKFCVAKYTRETLVFILFFQLT